MSLATNNMGVNALAVGAVRTVLHHWPQARIVLLDYERQARTCTVDTGTARIDVPFVNIRFSKNLFLPNHVLVLMALVILCRLIPSETVRAWLGKRNPWLRALDEIDLAASVAGGDSFSDIYGIGRFVYVALPQLLCLLAGKPLVVMPQTLGPFRNPLVRRCAKHILRRADRVYSRERRGIFSVARMLASQPDRTQVRFSPDLGLLLNPAQGRPGGIEGIAADAPARCLVGLNVSGLLWDAGATLKTRAQFHADYKQLIRELIDMLISRKDASVLLVPHVFGESPESDTIACRSLYEEAAARYPGRLAFASRRYDQHEVKALIGSCDLFIGSRMHACIAAVSQYVPAVSIAYSDKFIGVMETLGAGGWVADLRSMRREEICAIVADCFEKRDSMKGRLQLDVPETQRTALNLFADFQLG